MTKLNRVIGPFELTLYGVGVTLGAGIYALVGEMAGAAGSYAPLAFLLAGALAALTGLSYAELGSRYPESAGEAAYVANGFDRRWVTAIAGYGVALTGSISSAVVLHGFAGYIGELVDVPGWLAITGALALLVAVAAWGVRTSIWMAGAITLIEAAGLLLIIAVAAPDALQAPAWPEPPVDGLPWAGIFAASVMAFFAFIGFEDIVNMAEETRRPQRTIPLAILITLAVSSVLYVAVSFVAVNAMDPAVLAEENGPLAAVFEQATGLPGAPVAIIAVLAMINGALVQIIMASRVLYGLANRKLSAPIFAVVHPQRRTPVFATAAAGLFIWILAMSGALAPLAIAASTVTLLVFALVNAALLAVRYKTRGQASPGFTAPIWAPVLGVLANLAVVSGVLVDALS